MGHGSELDEKKPRKISVLSDITFVSCGGYHSAVITSKGELLVWGWNHFGQLGADIRYRCGNAWLFKLLASEEALKPTAIKELKGKVVSWVACGEGHTVAIVS